MLLVERFSEHEMHRNGAWVHLHGILCCSRALSYCRAKKYREPTQVVMISIGDQAPGSVPKERVATATSERVR